MSRQEKFNGGSNESIEELTKAVNTNIEAIGLLFQAVQDLKHRVRDLELEVYR